MPSTSSGRITKARRNKALPTHHKNHRWESFTAKVAKLHSLDPLRKVRRHDLDAEDLSSTTSYFRSGLEKWADLNLSKAFVSFRREVLPLSESLPQILHFEHRIVDLLASYIEKQDKEGLEPLLDLLTALAHDLGVRFERHYRRALDLVVAIANRPQDVEVIEWTFAALAFLFKYLSRLLVPDLRPTYDALASLLGKGRNPPHIARFAAEALSFLVKKAATPSHRDTALVSIVEHVRDDLLKSAGTKQPGLYKDGVMTMFAEAMKSSGQTLHSTAPDIYVALIRSIPDTELVAGDQTIWTDVCCGVLTSVIHHSTPETFQPLAKRVLEHLSCLPAQWDESTRRLRRRAVSVRLLGVLSGVRKGGRITDWSSILHVLVKMIEDLPEADELSDADRLVSVWRDVATNAAIVWSVAPMDAVLPSLPSFSTALSKKSLAVYLVPFCSYLASLHPERFRSLFQMPLQRFISAHWSDGDNEDLLCVLLPEIISSTGLSNRKEPFPLPQSWQDHIVNKFEKLEVTPFPERGAYDKDAKTWRDKCLPKYSALLRVLDSTAVQQSTNARIAELLLRKLKLALRPSAIEITEEAKFIVSDGFSAYLKMSTAVETVDEGLDPLLNAAAPRFCRLPGFLKALLEYKQYLSSRPHGGQADPAGVAPTEKEDEDPLAHALVTNLSTPSHDVRLTSLRLLKLSENGGEDHAALAIMLQVEETPLEAQNTRTIAVQLRKLGQVFGHLQGRPLLQRAIPHFLFGMTTVRMSPVWDDAVEALKQVAQSKTGEELVTELAFAWLNIPSFHRAAQPTSAASDARQGTVTDFECTNLESLRTLAEQPTTAIKDPFVLMLDAFEKSQAVVLDVPLDARQKALKVLAALPALAEKRSRKLVPSLLSWTGSNPATSEDSDGDAQDDAEQSWSLADRKLLIGIFAQFVNPKVLYQSDSVYSALLKLLENGDVQIQKLALKAILAWKQEGIKPYQENLEFLLDDARLKNEITVLFQGDNPVQPEHRPEIMPVLLRLLYGRSIAKKQAGIRLSIIRSLNLDDLGDFLVIALGELAKVQIFNNSELREAVITTEVTPPRKLVGIMNMMDSIISELGAAVLSFMDLILPPITYCLFHTGRQLRDVVSEEDDSSKVLQTSLLKDARSTALKCLCKLFQNAQSFDWTPYQSHIVSEVVTPRIDMLAAETTQGVSGTWRLLETWSALPKTAMMFSLDSRILSKILECLAFAKTKPEVKIFALGIVRNLIRLSQAPAVESEHNELIKSELLDPNADLILSQLDSLLQHQLNNDHGLLEAAVRTVIDIAPLIDSSGHARSLVDISAFLLRQPSKDVPPKVKGAILLILQRFIGLGDLDGNDDGLKDRIRVTLSALFSFFKDRQNRETLAVVFQAFAAQEASLRDVALLCVDLNSWRVGKIDVPDYDKRLAAFQSLSRQEDAAFSIDQWLPLLHNLVFYLHKDEEFGILASNSADALCKFVEAAQKVWGTPDHAAFEEALSGVVLPALYAGARESSETARRETLRVLGYIASHLRSWAPVVDLGLLCPTDEDSDKLFFYNVLSPAASRQLQAMHLLSDANEQAPLSGKNTGHFFIPLLEHFIFSRREGGDDHGLGAQATSTIASLASSLEWPSYKAILRRYISYVESKPDLQKQVVRLLEKFVDALSVAALSKRQPGDEDAMQVDPPLKVRRLTSTLPETSKLADEITKTLLPTLLDYLHEKDETLVSARVPVGVIVVKLLKLLPPSIMVQMLPGVLTDITHILRSKAWESREMARDTLAKISTILGSEHFGFLLKELRGALTKGYQLHVLSYTMHSLLVAVIPQLPPGELDYCLPTIVSVIMDDVFGVTGMEKDADEYTAKMKEIKSSKSQDSMELIAKNASVSRLVDLVQPLKALLMEKLDIRTVRKIDELLSRITAGLLHNRAAESRDTLVFCYQVIQEAYQSEKPETQAKLNPRLKRYLIQKGAARDRERGTITKHTYKLVRFAVDILRTVIRKHDSLRNATNLTGFLPILGDAIVAGEEEVRIAAFKLLGITVKVPFPAGEADSLYKMAAKEATKAVSTSTSTASDLAQSALKLLSVILRDRRETPIKDAAIDLLLGKVKNDLTEPLHRHVTFNFLRSVLERKVETAVVYDVLDHVGTVMITNDDKDTRDLARGAFFQFLREYPQKRNRWARQLDFVVANLKYDREGGRLSVMEVVHLLLMKSADDFVQEVVATCFIPLVFVLANDDSEKCCLAAAELLREIFRRSDKERLQKFLTLTRSWMKQGGEANPAVLRLALQTFALYFEAMDANASKNSKDLNLAVEKVTDILREDEGWQETGWELANTALRLIHVLLAKFPAVVLSPESADLWAAVRRRLTHSHETVRVSSVKLLGSFLADFARRDHGVTSDQDLIGSYGLRLQSDDIFEYARAALGLLSMPEVDEVVAKETAQILVFLAGSTVSRSLLDSEEARQDGDEDGDSSDDEEEEHADATRKGNATETTHHYILRRLSAIVRKETPPKAHVLVPKLAALDVLETMCQKTPGDALLSSARTILRPLRNITDPSVPAPYSTDELYKARHEAVRAKAQSVMDILQKKLGTADYTTQLLAVSGDVRERRMQRASKRKIEAVVHPERHGLEKKKRLEKKKERRKVKGQEQRSRRHEY